jgi:Zn finger protein HypA/HybF involved in hydrogenase expression
MFMEIGNTQEKIRLDYLTNEVHCEECLTVIDPEKTEKLLLVPITYICPNCGVAIDEQGWRCV